jgi:transcription elongation factor Elf1
MTRTYPCISTHKTLHGTLEVNWDKDYIGGFICPGNCGGTELLFYTSTSSVDKSIKTVKVQCKSCRAKSRLYQECPKPLISSHETLHDPLQINWRAYYDNSFQCPKECGSRNLRIVWKKQQVVGQCKKCDAFAFLKAELRIPCVSVHETLNGTIQDNWRADYNNDFQCPKECGSRELYFTSIHNPLLSVSEYNK